MSDKNVRRHARKNVRRDVRQNVRSEDTSVWMRVCYMVHRRMSVSAKERTANVWRQCQLCSPIIDNSSCGIKSDNNPHLTTPTRHGMVGITRSKVIFVSLLFWTPIHLEVWMHISFAYLQECDASCLKVLSWRQCCFLVGGADFWEVGESFVLVMLKKSERSFLPEVRQQLSSTFAKFQLPDDVLALWVEGRIWINDQLVLMWKFWH